MTERSDRSQDPSQDLSKLMEQSVTTLQEVDRRLQMVRSDLAALMTRATMLQGQAEPGLGAFGARQGFGFGGLPAPGAVPGFPAGPLAPGPYGPSFGGGPSPAMGAPAMPMMLPRGGATSGQAGEAGAAPNGPQGPNQGSLGREQRAAQGTMMRLPNVDIVDHGEEFVVQFELPGVKKEDLDLTISDRLVTLNATSRPEVERGVVLLNERPPTTYRRVLPLPAEVATTKCRAAFKDGILTLTVPKKAPTEGPRKVDVAYG